MKKVFRTLTVVMLVLSVFALSSAQVAQADSAALVGVNTTTAVYSAPSLTSDVVGTIFAGQTWFVNGKDSTGNWVQVQLGPNALGWVPGRTLGLTGVTLPTLSGFTGGSVNATAQATARATASATAQATARATASSTATVTVPYLVGVNTTTPVYTSPSSGAGSYQVGQLLAGQTWFVLGIDSTGKWVKVEIIRGTLSGWVAASALGLNGARLPTVSS